MKAVVWHGIGDIRLDEVPDPRIEQPTDAIIRITASAICGTDLHFVRGTFSPVVPGTILGHEAVGVVEEVGPDVRNFDVGDRVVVCSTIGCGVCAFCREGYYSQCDKANPNGPDAGTAFFGGPKGSGPIQGLQAEKARVPFAHTTLVKLPHNVSDEQAMNKNLTLRMGNCNHRKYVPYVVDLVANGTFDPTKLLSKQEPIGDAIESYKAFDKREAGWLKVELKPRASMV